MLKKILILIPILALLAFAVIIGFAMCNSQRADYGWDSSVKSPMFVTTHPHVVIDQAHNNASTAGWASRYWPFAQLLRHDGYEVSKGEEKFSASTLTGIDVLVIANASGAYKPQFMGLNLPGGTNENRGAPAFTAAEITALQLWVANGGSLLLIADHAPFGAASAGLAEAFGVRMYQGFVEVPNEISDPLLFSNDNYRLGDHPIITGGNAGETVHRVMTFTGQSLDGPAEAGVLLALPDSAVEYVPDADTLKPQQAGSCQGLAMQYRLGRVVILGEAAMLTAQVADGKPFGMDSPANDNRKFALNTLHWLSRKI